MFFSWWIRYVIWNESEDLRLYSDIEEGRFLFISWRLIQPTPPYCTSFTFCQEPYMYVIEPTPGVILPHSGCHPRPPLPSPPLPGIISFLYNLLFKLEDVSFVSVTCWLPLSLFFFLYFSSHVLLPKRLISETEDAIRSRLKPLLDRAEVLERVQMYLLTLIVGQQIYDYLRCPMKWRCKWTTSSPSFSALESEVTFKFAALSVMNNCLEALGTSLTMR